MQRIVIQVHGGDVLDRAMVFLLFDAIAGIEQPLAQLPGVGQKQCGVQAIPTLIQVEERGAQQARVVGDFGAVAQGQIDELRIRCGRNQLVVAEPPAIIRRVGRDVASHGQSVAGQQVEAEAQVVRERLDVLLHDPESQ